METNKQTLAIYAQQLQTSYKQLPVVQSMNEIIELKPVAIASIKTTLGEPVLKAFIAELIIDFCDFFNVKSNINENQVMQTVDLIIGHYYYLSLEDFKMCFTNGKLGKNVKIYDRIDGSIIFEMIEKHAKLRSETFAAVHEKQHDSIKYKLEKQRG
jgi:hypothetical protein